MITKVDIKGLFEGLQNQMVAQLNTNREFVLHSGSKGESLENVWIEWLRKYLPTRYCVDKAIVIDSNGDLSHQIDLVIYDQQYTPFVLTQNGIHYIPAEGVYAVFEVKPDLKGNVGNESYFEYAGSKIESVRRLKRTSVKIINAGCEVNARPLTKIIGGLLASTNSYANNSTIETHIRDLKALKSIEIGCAIDYGSFLVNYEGQEDIKNLEFEARILDYYNIRSVKNIVFSKKENSLVTFFLQLTRYLQQSIGTVAAIDLNAYSMAVGFTIDDII
jgi:hypothetical protein